MLCIRVLEKAKDTCEESGSGRVELTSAPLNGPLVPAALNVVMTIAAS